jgi:serine/threonine protein kinase
VPRIIDFGIAKAASLNLADQTLLTLIGQFVGTPGYMSIAQPTRPMACVSSPRPMTRPPGSGMHTRELARRALRAWRCRRICRLLARRHPYHHRLG